MSATGQRTYAKPCANSTATARGAFAMLLPHFGTGSLAHPFPAGNVLGAQTP